MLWTVANTMVSCPVKTLAGYFCVGSVRERFYSMAAGNRKRAGWLILAALLPFGCRGGGQAPTAPAVPASAKVAVEVTTVDAILKTISDSALITGALGSLNDVTVGIKTAG